MKLLLINPKFPESFWSFKWASEKILPTSKSNYPPLGLATLAALCPDDWDITIIDENIEPIPLQPEADLIGICGMGVQFDRQKELMNFYRGQGHFVVVGGSYASLCPEEYETLADAVVAGEAENIWPQFCLDFEASRPQKLYMESGNVDMSISPTPRFDLLQIDKYRAVSLQFSRGCPFRCEFCDIIVMFGRKPRTKTVEQIGKELDLLREMNVRAGFFVDDNLIGNKPVAKELLAFLFEYQRQHQYQFSFGTEASLNMSQDEELLTLFNRANFNWVFIGIESPDEESLKETFKYQNMRQDMRASVQKIYAHGIDVMAGFIVGFDNDTPEIFEKQFRFIMDTGIQAAMIGLLMALPKTPLYNRLEKAGRLRLHQNETDNTKLGTNVIPKQMEYHEMVAGYRKLYYRLLEDRNISQRIRNKTSHLGKMTNAQEYSFMQLIRIMSKFVRKGLAPGGFSRIAHFLRSLPILKPGLFAMVVQDWITALAMHDYIERHFVVEFEKVNELTHSYLKDIEVIFHRYVNLGAFEVSLLKFKDAASNLNFSLKGDLDRKFFKNARRQLERVLQDTTSSVTLQIHELQESQVKHFEKLLRRLSQYGDRINIAVDDKLAHLLNIDSSVFNLVLQG